MALIRSSIVQNQEMTSVRKTTHKNMRIFAYPQTRKNYCGFTSFLRL